MTALRVYLNATPAAPLSAVQSNTASLSSSSQSATIVPSSFMDSPPIHTVNFVTGIVSTASSYDQWARWCVAAKRKLADEKQSLPDDFAALFIETTNAWKRRIEEEKQKNDQTKQPAIQTNKQNNQENKTIIVV